MEQIGKALLYYGDKINEEYEQNEAYDLLLHAYQEGRVTSEWLKEYLPESFYLQEFSERRGNIVRWLGLEQGAKVLEIGAGCGAVTEVLLNFGCEVTCVEESFDEARINAYRNGGEHAFSIYPEMSCLKDERKYDWILVWNIGDGKNQNIQIEIEGLFRYLKKDGRILITFSNRYGLRKWGGYRQKYTDPVFGECGDEEKGISWNGIKKIMKGLTKYQPQLFYPYPDAQHTIVVYSDDFLPTTGELFKNEVPFQEGRLEFFQESRGFDQLIKDEMFPEFSNAYALLLGGKLEWLG